MASNPFNAFETRMWQNTAGYRALAPTSVNGVTRYVIANRTTVKAHSTMSLSPATVKASLSNSTKLVGHYVDAHWFRVDSGTYAGLFVSSGVPFTTSNQAAVNDRLNSMDLCTVPTAMRRSMNAKDASMGCEPLNQLVALDRAMYAGRGQHVREWEAYRSYATQLDYWRRLGPPTAAVPGTSNHGLGGALDLNYPGVSLTFRSPQVLAFLAYGPGFGWIKPSYLMAGASNPEPWHFEFTG